MHFFFFFCVLLLHSNSRLWRSTAQMFSDQFVITDVDPEKDGGKRFTRGAYRTSARLQQPHSAPA